MQSRVGEADTVLGCEAGQRSLPSLDEVSSELRPIGQLRARESQVGGREWAFQAEGICNRGWQGEALSISVIPQYFSLAEGVEFKVEKEVKSAEGKTSHQGIVSQTKHFDFFQWTMGSY